MLKGLFFSVLLFGFSANAALLIEPYIGYDFGEIKSTPKMPVHDIVQKTSNVALGARLGYKFFIPWVALDYTTGSGKAEFDSPGVPSADYTKTSLGVVVGADLPLGLRVYGGYGFSNDLKFKAVDASDTDSSYKGSYTKAGLGYKIIPLLALNAEYIMNKYTKMKSGDTDLDVDTVYSSYEYNTVMVSLSVPFSL